MTGVLNHFLGRAQVVSSQQGASRWGIVKLYDKDAHTADIETDEGVIAKDVPIATMGAGATSFRYAPHIGEMAFYTPDSNDSNSLVIHGFGHSDVNRPTDGIGLQPGEFVLSTQEGFLLHISADGAVTIKANTATITIPKTMWEGDINLQGKLTATDVIESKADIIAPDGSLNTQITEYNEHVHKAPTIGGPTTPPLPQFDVEPED